MTIVFKISDNLKDEMIKFYYNKRRDKTPPYAVFTADDADTNITLYSSGKVVFQGNNADIDANIWKDLEKHRNNRDIDKEINDNQKEKKEETKDTRFINIPTMGSDEVGTGDYFGPIVVTASYVDKEHMNMLYNLGVRDSKKINDETICKIAPTLIKEIPHVTYILDNKTYNKYPTNMNKIKAVLHNKVLCELAKKPNLKYDYIVIDQFCYPKNYFEYIKDAKEKITKITFTTKAEDKCLSVAVSSIISRYIFIKEFEKLGESLKIFLQKGAGTEVDKQGVMIVNHYGLAKLEEIAKLNFKNTEKIKALINK
jgi:ribonuclease HIII